MFAHFSSSHQFRRILLIQFGTVSDIIHTLPIVNILRFRFPAAKIAWLASPEMIEFLNSYNIADRIILAKPGWYKRLYETNVLRNRLSAFSPDLCLDFHGDIPSGLAIRLSGNGKRLSISESATHLSHLEKRLAMLEELDIAGASIDYEFPEIGYERHTVAWVAHELGMESAPFAMIGVGVQSNTNHWERNRYVQVAEHLSDTHGLHTLVAWQNDREKRLAEKVVAESGGKVALTPSLTAVQFVALARRAKIYVGTDNDFLLIAAALGIPCVGVLCDEISLENRSYSNNFQWVKVGSDETQRNRRGINPIRIDNYTYDVLQVCKACDDILQQKQPYEEKNHGLRPRTPQGTDQGKISEIWGFYTGIGQNSEILH